ncbi:DUF6496 domain-containing protein [Roseomonas marmotae]|uniref:Plasmid stabilization protein n=1 Tax=Roseomonas marmotae TaxID=2768161 RepID=A0ABS3KC64_9PROT|nr:DUF6496 domain-containing protein [Roseomonas marmotae]MBO1075042.1 hypothetical protein [Roseomonas marmotae]QTI79924.1 hypothetical protein IAI58_03840 [Roseomonas marmotae]
MPSTQAKSQKETVDRVMHEFKHGELKRGRAGKVKNPKQAIAIALSEAGASNQQSPQENRSKLRQTKAKERQAGAARDGSRTGGGGTTRAELYERAKKAGIPGRSRMDKAGLEQALRRHRS